MSENLCETHTFDQPADLPFTLPQSVKGKSYTNKAISLLKQSAENNKNLQLSLIYVRFTAYIT